MFREGMFRDKVFLITGGGTGLGLTIGKMAGSLGARICIVSRKEEHLREGHRVLTEMGIEAEWMVCDVRDSEAVERAVDHFWSGMGRIDVLVNNAAGNFVARTVDITPKGFRTIVDIVLNGTFNMSLYTGRRMISAGGGNIINIVTTYAWTGSAFVVPSAAAKAGVLAMTRSLAAEWGPHKIRVNAVAPGPFRTQGAWEHLGITPEIERKIEERNPLRRVGRPEEIAQVCLFLASDMASYINGACITADGGEWVSNAGQFNLFSGLMGRR